MQGKFHRLFPHLKAIYCEACYFHEPSPAPYCFPSRKHAASCCQFLQARSWPYQACSRKELQGQRTQGFCDDRCMQECMESVSQLNADHKINFSGFCQISLHNELDRKHNRYNLMGMYQLGDLRYVQVVEQLLGYVTTVKASK